MGKTVVYLDGSSQSCRFRECNMGNLICDAMVSGPQEARPGPGEGQEGEEWREERCKEDNLTVTEMSI